MSKQQIVVYHSHCHDGHTAAWVAWCKYGDAAEYVPAQYGDAPPDVTGKDVLIVDFSYKRPALEEMVSKARSLRVLDHHHTAQADLVGLPYAEFDMGRSGAGMTWDALQGTRGPITSKWWTHWLVDYVEDRDLWRFKLPNSKEINAFISAQKMTFERWDEISQLPLDQVAQQGAAVLSFLDRYVEEMSAQARRIAFCGHDVPIVNAPYLNVSELCGALAEGQPFAVVWFQQGDGQIKYSLRSRGDGAIDVSEIAKQFGGGGHKNSAAFTVDRIVHSLGADVPGARGATYTADLLRRALNLCWHLETATTDDEAACEAVLAEAVATGAWSPPEPDGLNYAPLLTRALKLIEGELPGLADGVDGEGAAILAEARRLDLYPGKKS